MEKAVNVILVGASGNGKSTFLNAFMNVARHKTLNDAENKVIQVAIPVRYTDGTITIKRGFDENERQQQAGSRTVKPRIYIFPTQYVTLRIIDTPGIGDTGGSKFDEAHIANILSCITRYKDIHGILFFFKRQDNRLFPSVKYQLCELLSCLGKAAVRNINFVITNAGPFCKTGEAVTVIEEFISTMGVHIPRTAENTFCFENEPFFYLVGRANPSNTYSKEERELYSLMYQRTAREYKRLVHRLFSCATPYSVSNMTALKKARQLWPLLRPRLAVLDNYDKDIEQAIKHHDDKLDRLMWEISGELGRLEKYKTESYTVDVEKERVEIETTEVDITVPEVDLDTVVEDVRRQRVEFVGKDYDVTKYRVVNDTVEEDVVRQVVKMVTREKPVERQKLVYDEGFEDGGPDPRTVIGNTATGAAVGSTIPVVGTGLGAVAGLFASLLGSGGSAPSVRMPRLVTYKDTETVEVPVIDEVTTKVAKVIQRVESYTEKETRQEPIVVDFVEKETKQVPVVVNRNKKEQREVPKVVKTIEQEEREKLVKYNDPEVQRTIDEKEAAKTAEGKRREEREVEYMAFLKEKEHVRELVLDFARCLQENTIVAFTSAKKQYLEEELKTTEALRPDEFDVKIAQRLKEKLVEVETVGRIFAEVSHGNIDQRILLTPAQLLKKVEEMCTLKNFGPYIKEALEECKEYSGTNFETIRLEEAARGYLFEEVVQLA